MANPLTDWFLVYSALQLAVNKLGAIQLGSLDGARGGGQNANLHFSLKKDRR